MSKLPDYHLETTLRIEPPRGKSRSFRIRYISPDTENKWTLLRLPEIDPANQLFIDGTVSAEHTNDKLKLILAAQYAHRDRKKKRPKIPLWKREDRRGHVGREVQPSKNSEHEETRRLQTAAGESR